MTFGINFHTPSYNSKYGAEGLKKQMEVKQTYLQEKAEQKQKAKDTAGIIGLIGVAATAVLGIKNRGKLQELGTKAINNLSTRFPNAKESVKKAGENIWKTTKKAGSNVVKFAQSAGKKVSDIFKKKA